MWAVTHPPRPLPAPREVHLWCLFPEDIQDCALQKAYEGFLTSDEKKNVADSKNVKMQTERLLARTLVRTTLARYTGGMVDPSCIRFTKNVYGKPKVMWPLQSEIAGSWRPPRLCFNLSHTNSLLACAVTLNTPVGVDVEERDRKFDRDMIGLALRFFSREEAHWLSGFRDPIEQRRQFLQLWTLNEAYVKAVGKGISKMPLRDFSFSFTASPLASRNLEKVVDIPAHAQARIINLEHSIDFEKNPNFPANAWQFLLLQPSPLHFASVCTRVYPLGQSEETKLDGLDYPFKVKIWRTVPLIGDEVLWEGAEALGLSASTQDLSTPWVDK